ncbi:MAG: tetratricopeptide repeat protein [Rhodobacterales bacterium]|nr:tetratricopeptide repeat protein [Rhodobacterales bacterium]
MRTAPVALALGLALSGCLAPGLQAPENAAPAVDAGAAAVDGLTVGHRLMAAGEYDLALRAYLRAAAEQGVNADTLSAIGSANLHLGRLGQAEQILRRALEEDPTFVPALNNLGVVLMERGKTGEAKRVFEQAFAYDRGETAAIRENLRLAIAQAERNVYDASTEAADYSLVRQARGQYLLLSTF